MMKEAECRVSPFAYEATLEDGTVIHVMTEGKAIDLNGNTYTARVEHDEGGSATIYWLLD